MITLNDFLDIGYNSKVGKLCVGVRVPSGYDHYVLKSVCFTIDVFGWVVVNQLNFEFMSKEFTVYTYNGLSQYSYSYSTKDGFNLITIAPDYFVIALFDKILPNYNKFRDINLRPFVGRFGACVPLSMLIEFNDMYNV